MATPGVGDAESSGAASVVAQFDAVYERHARELYDYFVARTSEPELARDLVQETCVRLWRAIADVARLDEGRRRAWLFTVARNLLVDEYRARASARTKHDAAATLLRADETLALAADADLDSKERVREVDRLLAARTGRTRGGIRCSRCGTPLHAGARFCPSCGQPLQPAARM